MKKDKIYPVDPPGYPDLDFKINKDDELEEAREGKRKLLAKFLEYYEGVDFVMNPEIDYEDNYYLKEIDKFLKQTK